MIMHLYGTYWNQCKNIIRIIQGLDLHVHHMEAGESKWVNSIYEIQLELTPLGSKGSIKHPIFNKKLKTMIIQHKIDNNYKILIKN